MYGTVYSKPASCMIDGQRRQWQWNMFSCYLAGHHRMYLVRAGTRQDNKEQSGEQVLLNNECASTL